jgi:tryptophanyl-tRNA synthetase
MSRYLTGIQSSGKPHLGNILGAIQPAIAHSNEPNNESLYFIADLHAITTIKNPQIIEENVQAVAAAWLAFGFDTEKHCFYRQSDIPEVTEMTWYLGCFTPFPMLANAHSFKDKKEKLSDINAGLFYYPVLMACDILMYDAQFVPVGKDQIQHLEITRDIANAFNNHFKKDILTVPEVKVQEEMKLIPGTDGQKMSKSYGNTIDIFAEEKQLYKAIKSIISDSTPLDEPKNPENDVTFKLFSLIATESETSTLKNKYLNGGYGYGHAKKDLLEVILNKYKNERELYNHYIQNKKELARKLLAGSEKARDISQPVLKRVRKTILGR